MMSIQLRLGNSPLITSDLGYTLRTQDINYTDLGRSRDPGSLLKALCILALRLVSRGY